MLSLAVELARLTVRLPKFLVQVQESIRERWHYAIHGATEELIATVHTSVVVEQTWPGLLGQSERIDDARPVGAATTSGAWVMAGGNDKKQNFSASSGELILTNPTLQSTSW